MGIFVKIKGIHDTYKINRNVIANSFNVIGGFLSQFIAAKKYELQFNAQSIYLSHYLNDQFDDVLRRIYIINDIGLLDVFLFRNSELITDPEKVFLYRNSETIADADQVYLYRLISTAGAVDFLVVIPVSLSSLKTDPKFISSINKYSLPDKVYEIITI